MAPIKLKTFIIPKLLSLGFGAVIIAVTLWYLLFQARFLLDGPQVTLTLEPPTLQTERALELQGLASNITAIYLNGRPISTDESGIFTETVILENGYSVVSIDAVDRYGRTSHLERPFVYQPNKLLN